MLLPSGAAGYGISIGACLPADRFGAEVSSDAAGGNQIGANDDLYDTLRMILTLNPISVFFFLTSGGLIGI